METRKLARVESPGFPLLRHVDWNLDRFFDRFGFERSKLFEPTEPAFTPDIEVLVHGGEFVVRADVPGLKKEDITIEIVDNELVIRGERTHEKEERREGYYRSERSFGSFYRSIPLAEGVKAGDARAIVRDGVLEVRMPMAKLELKRTRIPVEGATEAAAKKPAA